MRRSGKIWVRGAKGGLFQEDCPPCYEVVGSISGRGGGTLSTSSKCVAVVEVQERSREILAKGQLGFGVPAGGKGMRGAAPC